MKDRILTGWTFTRVLYVLMGSFIIAQSIVEKRWLVIAVGGYFAAMGLFAFGCASGNCVGGNCTPYPQQKSKAITQEFEEVKTK